MSDDRESGPDSAFLTIASRLSFLSGEMTAAIEREVAVSGIDPVRVVMQKGVLQPVQLEIVQTLSRPTEIVPGYEILDLLGHGGMGIVYRARQINLDRVVALKTVLLARMSDPKVVSRFEQEARSVAKLRHPNIVQAFDFGRHEGRLFLAMEYLDGEDADAFISRSGQLDEAIAWGIARQAAAGLAHAAQAGLVHRDIKPGNLLLVEPPEGFSLTAGLPMVKIADFGLVLLADDGETQTRLTAEDTTVGTPYYMAPEQLSGGQVDHHADIYSIGATVYHMLAGHPPLHGHRLSEIMIKRSQEPAPDIRESCPAVSAETAALIANMLERDPENRPTDYATLLQRIDSLPIATSGSGSIAGQRLYSQPVVRSDTQAETAVLDKAVENVKTPDTVVPDTEELTRDSRKTRFGVIAGIVVLLVAAGYWFQPDSEPVPAPTVEYELSGWGETLYNGEDLEGWLIRHGSWVPGRGGFRGTMVGTDGLIARPLLRTFDGAMVPVESYRFIAVVEWNDADAIELRFGIAGEKGETLRHLAVRITEDAVVAGRRESSSDELVVDAASDPVSIKLDRPIMLQLDHRGFAWHVTANDKIVAELPDEPRSLIPIVELLVEGGPASFSDLTVQELVAKTNE